MLDETAFISIFSALAKENGFPLSQSQCKQFFLYHQLLLTYNKVMDLTNITDEEEMMNRHYLDSLSLITFEEAFKAANPTLIDVGSGAGFPGIPLAIAYPHMPITLLDSQKKRIRFLQEVVQLLQLNQVTLLHGRAETSAHQPHLREQFSIATARAVAPLPVLLEYLLPFVCYGGYALSLKGPKVTEEVTDGNHAAALLGGEFHSLFPLPAINHITSLLAVYQKNGITPKRFPRKAGIPAKRPLLKE